MRLSQFFIHSPSTSLCNNKTLTWFSSSSSSPQTPAAAPPPSPAISHSRTRKLISSQPDPLLSKEFFNISSLFPPHLSHLQTLILKLAIARRFSHSLSLLCLLPSPSLPLLTSLIITFSLHSRPDLSLSTLSTLLRHHPPNLLPLHLHRQLIQSLSSHPSSLPSAISLLHSSPDLPSHNLLIQYLSRSRRLSLAIPLFRRLPLADPSSYHFLIQGFSRRAQLTSALSMFEEMLNRGITPDSLTYTTLLNALCRKHRLREAVKLLGRMPRWGCAPDIVHFSTVIVGLCREGSPVDACRVLDDMPVKGVGPDLVCYTNVVNGLCGCGEMEKAKGYLVEMVGKGLVPHFSVFHKLVMGFCNAGKHEEGCEVMEVMLSERVVPHVETWMYVVAAVCEDCSGEMLDGIIMRMAREEEWRRSTRIVQAVPLLDDVMGRLRERDYWRRV